MLSLQSCISVLDGKTAEYSFSSLVFFIPALPGTDAQMYLLSTLGSFNSLNYNMELLAYRNKAQLVKIHHNNKTAFAVPSALFSKINQLNNCRKNSVIQHSYKHKPLQIQTTLKGVFKPV